MSKLKIGQKLYRYTGVSILGYEVYGVVKRDVGTLYEIKCLDCRDHEQCELLIAESKENHGFKFIDMISEESQSYWHGDNDRFQRYQLSKTEAVKCRAESAIEVYKESIKKNEKSIEFNQGKIRELEATIEALNEPVNPTNRKVKDD